MVDDLFLGEFKLNGHTYTVTEEDYLELPDEALDLSDEDIINAVKHIAVQHQAKLNPNNNTNLLRGDYQITADPVEFEGTVLLFDANNLAHRCRHVYDLSYKHIDVSITYGFLNVMAATIRRFKRVTSVIACWDGGVPQYRYDCIPSYKLSDHSGDEDYQEFLRQIIGLQELLPHIGVYSLRKPKAEADDLIYHAARLIHPDNLKIVVSTDQDLLQCINRETQVYQPIKEVLIDKALFKEYVGVAQEDYLVYRCMVGDGSDGIPGVKGIGDKTALKLIEEYGASPSNFINVATGINPEAKPMTPAIADKFVQHGLQGFINTMTAIRLDKDRCGVKGYLLEALSQNLTYEHMMVNTFLKRYAFVSLMDVSFYDCFRNLQRPRLVELTNHRFPKVLNGVKQPV